MSKTNEPISIVMVGHVDHGKSTVIGRLLAEIKALPQGKLEAIQEMCRRNAKPFEYAFLLDALKDEQSQGITIDAARCFFHTAKRRYILIDAPGHIEFLKNMVTGAARAEAALLVIDAREGIRENSKRHGYMLSMLGLRQMAVLVNKIDLVDNSQEAFEAIRDEYSAFLQRLGITPTAFIPVSGMCGTNIATHAAETPWYTGPTVLEQIDGFTKGELSQALPFRLPLQDVYKFTRQGDDRRIMAGTIATGTIAVGDNVRFQPSGKSGRIKTIEYFNGPTLTQASANQAPGFTLETQIYVKPGEWMVKQTEAPMEESTRVRVNLFWMGHAPMVRDKTYKLKLGAACSPIRLVEVLSVVDATELGTVADKQQVDRHDVAEVILETPKPMVFDIVSNVEQTGRLVLVDDYEIAGAGIILAAVSAPETILQQHIREREIAWKSSAIPREERAAAYGHGAKFVVFVGETAAAGENFARGLERALFMMNDKAYYLGIDNLLRGLDADLRADDDEHYEQIRRLGELARILTGAGQIFITSLTDVDDYDLQSLAQLNSPHEILVINIGPQSFKFFQPHLNLDSTEDIAAVVFAVCELLRAKKVITDYQI